MSLSAEPRSHPRSVAIVDAGALARNLRRAAALAPRGRVLAVLKANAYGHGAALLAPVAVAAGAVALGVGDSGEALELRDAGVLAPILVLGDLIASEIPDVVARGITPVLHSEGRVCELEAEARRQGRTIGVHVKVDSGMGRLGMAPERVSVVAARIRRSDVLRLDGLMSHLAGGFPQQLQRNRSQCRSFSKVMARMGSDGHDLREVHLRNSAGLLDPEERLPEETLARVGALLYGFHPSGLATPLDFEPVMTLRTQIVFLKDVPAGSPVGYGGSVTTQRRTRLAIIPFGYHDGMKRRLQHGGRVLVRGRRAPVFGVVSMDYTTLDITDVPGVTVGDVVTLVGDDGCERITIGDVAGWADTIAHDVAAGLGRRVLHQVSGLQRS